jgi:hypothetical protein
MVIILNERDRMATAVKLTDIIVSEAKINAKALNRSVDGQIEYWVKIGKIAEENPDMTYEFIKSVIVAKEEIEAGKIDKYSFYDKK